MKATNLTSPARTSLLVIKPCVIKGWEAVITNWGGGLPLTDTLVDLMSDKEADNLRTRLIHKGWTEA